MALGKTLAQIDALPVAEVNEWAEFFELEPFGLPASDALQANLASLLANIHRDTRARPEPFSLKDFLVFSRQDPTQNEDQQAPTVDGLNRDQLTLLLGFQALKVRSQKSQPLP